MGSGFVPSGRFGGKLAAMAGILAETDAYADFVGATVAADGAEGMYFYGIDRRDLAANDETFPAVFVIWDYADDTEWHSTQAGGGTYKIRGACTLVLEADTPSEYAHDTPGAYNWIMNHAGAMVGEMEALFGVAGRQEISRHQVMEGPYRECESGEVDYCCVVIKFEFRN